MALTIGTQLGSHEITALLGKGGMGEVYRARDLKLKREVAIKILPDEFACDPERVSRFQREAEVLASLNHPNIATIHDLEETDGTRYLVLELVEGETLADRIARGPIPIEAALHIAMQICEALEAAHERGIIHRDLKPANVKITPDGKVKVLDFGLAKAMENGSATTALSNSPTMLSAATNAGVIIGTAAYMSPEQAKGLKADHRSDIFSLGCVLYEMLTGRQAFQGETISDVLASVLAREPDLALLPPNLNPRIRDLIQRCLEKSPKRRWQAAGDLRVETETALANPRRSVVEEQRIIGPRARWKFGVALLLAAALGGAITAVGVWYLRLPVTAPVARFSFPLGVGQEFSLTGRSLVAISPDGTHIIYVANGQLYLRSIDQLEAKPITSSGSQAPTSPAFSPDGQSVVYYSTAGTLQRIAVSGGTAVTICAADNPFGVSWDKDWIVFGQADRGIMRVSPDGNKPEIVVAVQPGERAYGPQVLPGGKTILFTLATGASLDRWDKAQIVVQSLTSGQRKTLIRGSDAHFVPTGHIVYAVGGTLFGVPFDLERLEVTGGPTPVLEGVRRAGLLATGTANFSFSKTGTLIYVPGPIKGSPQSSLALVDRDGVIQPLKLPPGSYSFPRVSPDGKKIAYTTDDGKEAIVWTYELSGTAPPRRLTYGGSNRYPIWSADGKHVAFQSDREGDGAIFWQPADSGDAERLTKPDPGIYHIPDSWSPDGERFSFSASRGDTGSIWIFSIRDKKATPFVQSQSSAFFGRSVFSPDGRWLGYLSTEYGTHIYVEPYPATGAKHQVSDGGYPVWSRDGKELFYTLAGLPRFFSLSITTQPNFKFGSPVPISKVLLGQEWGGAQRNYDIMPDGKRFVGLIAPDQLESGASASPQIQVVLNWFEDLKRRVPVH
jgi:serine/threonine-protein kinase